MSNKKLIKRRILTPLTPKIKKELLISAKMYDGKTTCHMCNKTLTEPDVDQQAKKTGFCSFKCLDEFYGIDSSEIDVEDSNCDEPDLIKGLSLEVREKVDDKAVILIQLPYSAVYMLIEEEQAKGLIDALSQIWNWEIKWDDEEEEGE